MTDNNKSTKIDCKNENFNFKNAPNLVIRKSEKKFRFCQVQNKNQIYNYRVKILKIGKITKNIIEHKKTIKKLFSQNYSFQHVSQFVFRKSQTKVIISNNK